MIVIDTNLLVCAHRTQAPEHQAARECLEAASRRPDGWGFAVTSVLEFWAVVTHPAAAGRPSFADEARGFVDSLMDAGALLLEQDAGAGQRLLDAAERLGVVGPRIFDLQIALTALEHGATEVWTRDGGFITPPGLLRVDPFAA